MYVEYIVVANGVDIWQTCSVAISVKSIINMI